MRSVVVVLPASTWAMMPMFRSFCSIVMVMVANKGNPRSFDQLTTIHRSGDTPRTAGHLARWVAVVDGHGCGPQVIRPAAERIELSRSAASCLSCGTTSNTGYSIGKDEQKA